MFGNYAPRKYAKACSWSIDDVSSRDIARSIASALGHAVTKRDGGMYAFVHDGVTYAIVGHCAWPQTRFDGVAGFLVRRKTLADLVAWRAAHLDYERAHALVGWTWSDAHSGTVGTWVCALRDAIDAVAADDNGALEIVRIPLSVCVPSRQWVDERQRKLDAHT
jgi:hypothetical protein